jgi:hypothetical protein
MWPILNQGIKEISSAYDIIGDQVGSFDMQQL